MKPCSIVIHAGVGPDIWSEEKIQSIHKSLKEVLDRSYDKVQSGSQALDVVTYAVALLEDDPQFNAGTGSMLQSDGEARMSCSLMDGTTGRFSGLINIQSVKNPIAVAKILIQENDRVLSGQGAQAYARSKGFSNYDPVTPHVKQKWMERREKEWKLENLVGTVGAACMDQAGALAVATSTGGKGMEIVGRVSDSATIAGNYASKNAAISCTGVGEEIVEGGLAVKIVARVDDGLTLQQAFEKTFEEFRTQKGRAGAIGVDAKGNVVVDFTTPCMLRAYKTSDQEFVFP